MIVKLFASLGLALCIALAIHMCLGQRRQYLLQAWWNRVLGWLMQRLTQRFDARERRLAAHQEALAAIDRARRGGPPTEPAPWPGEWDGNVYRPSQFQKPTKPH